MAQTVANLTDVLKEAWTSDQLEKQFYDDNPFLQQVEKLQATMIGEKALVPIHAGRNSGYTSTAAAGGSLNAAGQQAVDAAEYTLIYHWQQIQIQTAALNQTGSGAQSVVVAKDLEIAGAVNDMRKECMRQVVTNGDSVLAQCDSGGASTTVELLVDSATAYGFQSIVRGWLYAGRPVDIGTAADSDADVAGEAIVSVSESATDPDIVMTTSITTTSADFVTVPNPNGTATANPEMNGLRNIVNTSGALGGLNPSTAAEAFWKAASRDTGTTVFSLDLGLDLSRSVHQKTGGKPNYVLTSLKQKAAFYNLLQNQARFVTDGKFAAGNVDDVLWNGMTVHAEPDVLDQDWFCLTLEDLGIITGSIKKPTWASDIEGSGGKLRWGQGTTAFNDAVVYPINFIAKRRNSHAAATGLIA
jgi:hypothetical protein